MGTRTNCRMVNGMMRFANLALWGIVAGLVIALVLICLWPTL